MRPSAAAHDALAGLLEYPRDGHAARVRSLAGALAAEAPDAAAHLAPFVELAAASDLAAAEELYVRTFDVNAERALEVGWQVFGEQYARGAFLVRLRETARAVGVPETTELPDHLTQVLRLLGRMDEEDARAVIRKAVAPALRRVRGDLGDGHPYSAVLDAVRAVVDLHGAGEDAPAAAGPHAASVPGRRSAP